MLARLLNDVPIKRKLTIITMVATTFALVLVGTAVAIYDQVSLRRDLVANVAAATEMVSFYASAIEFDDHYSANRVLGGLSAQTHIVAARIYAPDGYPFATYLREGTAADHLPATVPAEGTVFSRQGMQFARSVRIGSKNGCTICVQTDAAELTERVLGSLGAIAAALAAAAWIAYLVTTPLQRVISGPISRLATVAARVAWENDYSARAVKQGDDEVGALIDGFNNMLTQVQARDAALKKAHDELEARVEERTRELKAAKQRIAQEKARLRLIFDSVPVGISLREVKADGSADPTLLNDAHLRICGVTRQQASEPGIFRRISHLGDYEQQLVLDAQLQRGETSRFSLEKRYLHADGKVVWVLFSREHHRLADGGYEELSTIVDITALKSAQEEVARERARFKFIFDSVPVGISFLLPGDAEARAVNPAYGRITGIAASEITDSRVFARATHPEDQERQRPLVAAFKRGEIDRFHLEKRYVHPDGRVVWVHLSRRMFVDEKTGHKQAITTLVDITERKEAETRLAETHRQLLATSRAAGMAEVATGVLHNVGNVLNSVNVSATLVGDRIRGSQVSKLAKLAELLAAQGADLAKFFASDPRAPQVPVFLSTLAGSLQGEQRDCLVELESLRKNIDHIKEIVVMQQGYAKVSGVTEAITATELVEDALRMNADSLARHDIVLVRDFRSNPILFVEKHKVLQILVNLMRNAKHACEASGHTGKRMTVRITEENDRVKIAVIDNGVGIQPENLTRIFSHGFTTKKTGHGFGLHSGALAAKELGGALLAESDGPGCGAAFILELPFKPEAKAA